MDFNEADFENPPAKKTEDSIPSIPEKVESKCVEAEHSDSDKFNGKNISLIREE